MSMTRRALVLEGKFLISEDTGSHRFFCAIVPVSAPDCRTMILPLELMLRWVRSWCGPALQPVCKAMQSPVQPRLHTRKLPSRRRNSLLWRTGSGLQPGEEEEGWGTGSVPTKTHPPDCRWLWHFGESGFPPKRTLRKKITWELRNWGGRREGRSRERAELRWHFPWVNVFQN